MTGTSMGRLDAYKACFVRLAHPESPLYKALEITRILAESKSGLGEVIHDYARQSHTQLQDILNAIPCMTHEQPDPEDMLLLSDAGYILKTVATLLQIIPGSMHRNHTEEIGKTRKISAHTIETLHNDFIQSPDIRKLLELEQAKEI